MPDWIHSIIYLIVLTASVVSLGLIMESALGVVIGVFAGHLAGSALVSRLPGFWNRREK